MSCNTEWKVARESISHTVSMNKRHVWLNQYESVKESVF
jgi:hypothetical protein